MQGGLKGDKKDISVSSANIIFIGVASSRRVLKETDIRYYDGVVQVRPQQVFDYSLISQISKKINTVAISLPPIAAYPASRCIFFQRKAERQNKLRVIYLAILNISIIKTINISISVFIESIRNIRANSIILLGYVSVITALPALICAKLFSRPIFAIVPDAPNLVMEYSKTHNIIRLGLIKIVGRIDTMIQSKMSGYILFTKDMNLVINSKNKPFIVMEGFYDGRHGNIVSEKIPGAFRIMYAGSLHQKFGIDILISAFDHIKDTNVELLIFGNGDYVDEIKKKETLDTRIKYCGSRPMEEILFYEKKVDLLINTRSSKEKLTAYSFPSKMFEYMASGTPVLTTRMKGIPEEYYPYLYFIDDENPLAISQQIEGIINMSDKELYEFGEKAREFILKNKNVEKQVDRIYDFIIENV
jgi:glycosyltransferase involved in cell wall biosynthesis